MIEFSFRIWSLGCIDGAWLLGRYGEKQRTRKSRSFFVLVDMQYKFSPFEIKSQLALASVPGNFKSTNCS